MRGQDFNFSKWLWVHRFCRSEVFSHSCLFGVPSFGRGSVEVAPHGSDHPLAVAVVPPAADLFRSTKEVDMRVPTQSNDAAFTTHRHTDTSNTPCSEVFIFSFNLPPFPCAPAMDTHHTAACLAHSAQRAVCVASDVRYLAL